MELSDFSTLFKVQCLEEKIFAHLEQIKQHQGRIDSIEKQREEKENQLNDAENEVQSLKEELSNGEKELHDLSQTIERAKENLNIASNQKQVDALEAEINTLSPKASLIEEDLLEKMETIEIKEAVIQSSKEFLEGSKKTLSEIKIEVENDQGIENSAIEKLEKEANELLDSVAKNLKESYLKTNEKYRFKNPLSFAINRKCHQCKFDIGGNSQTQIDTGRYLEFCPGCNRLLIPLSAKTGS